MFYCVLCMFTYIDVHHFAVVHLFGSLCCALFVFVLCRMYPLHQLSNCLVIPWRKQVNLK